MENKKVYEVLLDLRSCFLDLAKVSQLRAEEQEPLRLYEEGKTNAYRTAANVVDDLMKCFKEEDK